MWPILFTPSSPGTSSHLSIKMLIAEAVNLIEMKTKLPGYLFGSGFLLGHSGNERLHVIFHLFLGRSVAFS